MKIRKYFTGCLLAWFSAFYGRTAKPEVQIPYRDNAVNRR